MSADTQTLRNDLDQLQDDFVLAASVLGGSIGVLLCLVIGLYIWNIILSNQIKKKDPLTNFRLNRPKLIQKTAPNRPQPHTSDYDNPGFSKNPLSQYHTSNDMNPISTRTRASMDNGNFSFGSPPPTSDSFHGPNYVDRNSKFY